jgi:hypothetical protein
MAQAKGWSQGPVAGHRISLVQCGASNLLSQALCIASSRNWHLGPQAEPRHGFPWFLGQVWTLVTATEGCGLLDLSKSKKRLPWVAGAFVLKVLQAPPHFFFEQPHTTQQLHSKYRSQTEVQTHTCACAHGGMIHSSHKVERAQCLWAPVDIHSVVHRHAKILLSHEQDKTLTHTIAHSAQREKQA